MAQTHSLDLEASSSQYASAADSASLSITGNFTIEMWVRFESLPSSGNDVTLAGKWNNDTNNREYRVGIRNSAGTYSIQVVTSTNGSAFTEAFITWSLASSLVGQWVHIAVSKNSTTATAYINGVSIGTGTVDSSQFNGNSSFGVGALVNSSPTQFVDALFKDVRVFNDVRSAAEIATDAWTENVSDANLMAEWNLNNAYTDSSGNSNTPTGSGSPTFSTTIPWNAPNGGEGALFVASMISWWSLDETSGNAADSHGSNTLTNTGVVYSAGKIENGADFERADSSDNLSIADASQTGLDFNNAFSVACWVKIESAPGAGVKYTLVGKYNGGGGLEQYQLNYRDDSGLKIDFQVAGTGSTQYLWSKDLGTGTWHHLVAVFYGTANGDAEMFLDGVSLGAVAGSVSAIANTATPFTLGNDSSGSGSGLDGMLDEVSVYNIALDYGNALDLYAAGTGIPYSAGTAYDETYSESQTATDSVEATVQRTLSESKTATDDLLATPARTLSESQTPTDTFASAFIILETLSEAVSAVDSVIRSGIRVLADSVTATATFIQESVKNLLDSITASDTFTSVLSYGRILTESVGATDIIRKVLNGNTTFWNSLTKTIGSWTDRDKI